MRTPAVPSLSTPGRIADELGVPSPHVRRRRKAERRADTARLCGPDQLDKNVIPADTSSMATVRITPEALEQTDRLPAEIVARVEKLYERLRKWPAVSGAKALSASLAGHWRLRTGDYRVQFRVAGQSVIVEKVGHRDRFYKE